MVESTGEDPLLLGIYKMLKKSADILYFSSYKQTWQKILTMGVSF